MPARDGLPIPPAIWERMTEWLAPDRWGEITLTVKRGKVTGCTIVETIRVGETPDVDRRQDDIVVSS